MLNQTQLRELAICFNISLERLSNDYTANYSVKCPFHDDNTNSGSVNFSKGVYNCHASCGGYTLEKVYEHFGLVSEPTEQSNYTPLAEPLDLDSNASQGQKTAIKTDYKADLEAFFKSRGLPSHAYKHFNATAITDSSLNGYGYIVFPNGDSQTGRLFLDEDLPKYLNAKGEKPLFNLENIDRTKDVILVEGIFDLMAVWSLGFTNTVAALGSGQFNEKQAYNLRKNTVFILFDRDYAGYKGAKDAAKALKAVGGYPIIIELPEQFGKDPNDAYLIDKLAFQQWLQETLDKYDRRGKQYLESMFNAKPLRYLPTGISKLDKALGGGFKEGFHAIAGQPGVGKSAFGLFLSKKFVELGNKGLYITYEIPIRQCWSRLLAMYEQKPWSEIEMEPNNIAALTKMKSISLAEDLNIEAGWNLSEIQRASKNYDFIVVDYLQRMPGDAGDDRAKINHNISGLSDLARDHGKIIIAISSISRDKYQEFGSMSIFKESGNIEYVIQSGMCLYPKGNNLGLVIVKNTRGGEIDMTLKTDLSCDLFEEL